jgi:hypothetical protein
VVECTVRSCGKMRLIALYIAGNLRRAGESTRPSALNREDPSPVTKAVVVPLGVQVPPTLFDVLQLRPATCVVGAAGVLVMRVQVMVVPGLSIT